jgi:two-component system, NtrC family, response regulator AtoC
MILGPEETKEEVRRLTPVAAEKALRIVMRNSLPAPKLPGPDLIIVYLNGDTVTREFPAVRSGMAHTPLIILTTRPQEWIPMELLNIGPISCHLYPAEKKQVSERIASLYDEWLARKRKERFSDLQHELYDFSRIVGKTPSLGIIIDRAHKVIRNNAMMVLITGETGTGKELLARAIHYCSRTQNEPFVEIACTALPENLLEAELFGYEKGAFTDAKERKLGLFELAGEGTIFLDEIGDISLIIQSKLLKVVEQRTMRRVGGIQEIPVRARIITATSADLEAKMRSGEFRPDLYHRLKILPLELPPLRERKEDIPLLVESFLGFFNQAYGKKIRGITNAALQALMEHHWEGNIRELRHSIERAVLLEEGSWLTEADFDIATTNIEEARPHPPVDSALHSPDRGDPESLMFFVPLRDASMAEVQRMLVEKVLAYAGGNKLKAAHILKISRPRLDRILRAHSNDIGD